MARQSEKGRLFKSKKIKGKLIRKDSLIGGPDRPWKPMAMPYAPELMNEKPLLRVIKYVELSYYSSGAILPMGNIFTESPFIESMEVNRSIEPELAWNMAFAKMGIQFQHVHGLPFTGNANQGLRIFRPFAPLDALPFIAESDTVYFDILRIIVVGPDMHPAHVWGGDTGYLNEAPEAPDPFSNELTRQGYIFDANLVREDTASRSGAFSDASAQNYVEDITGPIEVFPKFHKQKTLVYADIGAEGYGNQSRESDRGQWTIYPGRDSDDNPIELAFYQGNAVWLGAVYVYTIESDTMVTKDYIPYPGGYFGFVYGNSTMLPMYGPDLYNRTDNEWGCEIDGIMIAPPENQWEPCICAPGLLWVPPEESTGGEGDRNSDFPEFPSDAEDGDAGGELHVVPGFGGVPVHSDDEDASLYTGQTIELAAGFPIAVSTLLSQLPGLCGAIPNCTYMGTVNWHHINTQPWIQAIKEFFNMP